MLNCIEAAESTIPGSSTSEVELNATVILRRKNVFDLNDQLARAGDDASDLFGKDVEFRLVSVDIDKESGVGKKSSVATLEGWVSKANRLTADDEGETYILNFKVDKEFGTPGAILVENHHPNWLFLKHITLHLPPSHDVHFSCNSWVYNHHHYDSPRIFFTNQVYLPNQTPKGLVDLRDAELKQLRGDSKGEREMPHRIYDYDVYNDLSDPDKDKELYTRPILGGSQDYPYPRRCRTGRDMTKTDPKSEKPTVAIELVYVPRDERFDHIKKSDFLASSIKSFAHELLPVIKRIFEGDDEFDGFHDIRELYTKGIAFPVDDFSSSTHDKKELYFKDPFEIIHELTDDDSGNSRLLKFPEEEDLHSEDAKLLSSNPMSFFLRAVSRQSQAIEVMSVLEILSTHASDEEYLGQRTDSPYWSSDEKVLGAYDKFGAKLKEVEANITKRNQDPALVNRKGAANIPYTLLFPSSDGGLSGRGIPNSTSI